MLQDDLKKVLNVFGKDLAIALNSSFNKALKSGGSKNVQEAKLNFEPGLILNNDGLTINVYASGKYWRFVEAGRKKGSRMPPSKAFDKKWQNLNNIDPRKIIFSMTVAYNQKKGFKSKPKMLPFDVAAKQYSFLVARKIKRDGIKPKPFRDKVVNDGRLDTLRDQLMELVGKDIQLNFNI